MLIKECLMCNKKYLPSTYRSEYPNSLRENLKQASVKFDQPYWIFEREIKEINFKSFIKKNFKLWVLIFFTNLLSFCLSVSLSLCLSVSLSLPSCFSDSMTSFLSLSRSSLSVCVSLCLSMSLLSDSLSFSLSFCLCVPLSESFSLSPCISVSKLQFHYFISEFDNQKLRDSRNGKRPTNDVISPTKKKPKNPKTGGTNGFSSTAAKPRTSTHF